MQTPQVSQFWYKNSKNSYDASIWTAFTTKFVLEAKVKNGTFWNISNLVFFQNSVALNIYSNNERGF